VLEGAEAAVAARVLGIDEALTEDQKFELAWKLALEAGWTVKWLCEAAAICGILQHPVEAATVIEEPSHHPEPLVGTWGSLPQPLAAPLAAPAAAAIPGAAAAAAAIPAIPAAAPEAAPDPVVPWYRRVMYRFGRAWPR
jgi:hypothetical protein